MYLPRYITTADKSFLEFEFISEGPKGSVRKTIRFRRMKGNVFNLAFGDFDVINRTINDLSITNNNDSKKILATVATVVHAFTEQYPNALIFATGSTASRTRLYRMGITNHWEAINKDFDVYGLKKNNWEPFIKGENYDGFLVRRKKT